MGTSPVAARESRTRPELEAQLTARDRERTAGRRLHDKVGPRPRLVCGSPVSAAYWTGAAMTALMALVALDTIRRRRG